MPILSLSKGNNWCGCYKFRAPIPFYPPTHARVLSSNHNCVSTFRSNWFHQVEEWGERALQLLPPDEAEGQLGPTTDPFDRTLARAVFRIQGSRAAQKERNFGIFRNSGKVRSLLFSSFKTLDPLVLQHWRSFLIVCSEVIRLCRCRSFSAYIS